MYLINNAEAGYEDFISFMCSLPNVDPDRIRTATGESCNHSLSHPANLNLPSVTVSAVAGTQLVHRTVNNVGLRPETYLCSVLPPNGTTVNVYPPWFSIASQGTQDLDIQINVTKAMRHFTFGEIVMTGSLNHVVRIPLSVLPNSISS